MIGAAFVEALASALRLAGFSLIEGYAGLGVAVELTEEC